MYSTTDTALPFWKNAPQFRCNDFSVYSKKSKSFSGIEIDILNLKSDTRNQVKYYLACGSWQSTATYWNPLIKN